MDIIYFRALRKAGLSSRGSVAAQGENVDLQSFISTFS